ncbi:MAG: STAS domain-containing protein [Actinomycetota bacterium]|nr:STAS domain-containing protein [Actinomycetota bacterium]
MTLQVTTDHANNIPIINVTGQIDMNNYVEVHELILSEISSGHPNIVLNFKKLNFMDSATLGMLLRSLDKAKQQGGLLVLVTNPFVDRVLAVTGLTHLFELFSSDDDAIARLLQAAS